MSLVGEVVKYQGDKNPQHGTVLAQIIMKQGDDFPISGFLIQNVSSNKLHSVEYFKLLEVIPSKEEKEAEMLNDQSDDFFNTGDFGNDILGGLGVSKSTTTTTNDDDNDLPF